MGKRKKAYVMPRSRLLNIDDERDILIADVLVKSWKEEKRTVIFFESPHRISKTINLLHEILGNRQVVLCRELTKMFEEIIRGDLEKLAKDHSERQWRGEITVVLAGCGKKK